MLQYDPINILIHKQELTVKTINFKFNTSIHPTFDLVAERESALQELEYLKSARDIKFTYTYTRPQVYRSRFTGELVVTGR